MRKVQKKQAEDFMALLNQVHREIKKYIENGSPAAGVFVS